MAAKRRTTTGPGGICPKCSKQMKRFTHHQYWRPKFDSPYWLYWDICRCGHVEHYEEARVWPSEEAKARWNAHMAAKAREAEERARKAAERKVRVGPGAPCSRKKCGGDTDRFEHPPGWQPAEHQTVFYRYWDKCRKCMKVSWPKEAKVELQKDLNDAIRALEREEAERMGHLEAITVMEPLRPL